MTATRISQDFLKSLGVNVHLGYLDTVYENVPLVTESLKYLGINNVRDAVPLREWTDRYAALSKLNIDFNLLMPVRNGTLNIADTLSDIRYLLDRAPGSVVAIEGPNEVNFWPAFYNGGTGLANQAQLQKDIYAAVKSDQILRDLPVFNLTLGEYGPDGYAALGSLSGAATAANTHIYFPSGTPPQQTVSYGLSLGQITTPGLPTVVTETGYYTLPSDLNGVNESVQAKYTLNLLFDYAYSGVQQTYLYELFDTFTDPTNSNRDAHFGLFRNDGTPKPVATAIKNLTRTLSTLDNDKLGLGASLNYTISGLPQSGHHLALQSADGSTELVVWAEPQIWDAGKHVEIAAVPVNIDVNLNGTIADVRVYDPLVSGVTPVASFRSVDRFTVGVSDHPLIIDLVSVTVASPPSNSASATVLPPSPSSSLIPTAKPSVVPQIGDPLGATSAFGLDYISQLGNIEYSPLSNAGKIYSLYTALLGRRPDSIGLEGFNAALKNGTSLTDIAYTILSSPERGGSPTNQVDFVLSLYSNILHRPADSLGMEFYLKELSSGIPQATVAAQVATSSEALLNLTAPFQAGVFVPNVDDMNVARLYFGILGRPPDAGGLEAFGSQVGAASANAGPTGALQELVKVSNAIIASPEYVTTHGGASNAAFVNDVFIGALGRQADEAGLNYFEAQLASGISRASVAVEITQAYEAKVHLVGIIEHSNQLMG